MRDTLEVLRELEDTLNRLDGREVHAGHDGHDAPARGDTAESLAASLRRRKIVRER